MGVVIDAETGTTELVILDSSVVEGPPRARIQLPHIVPPGFHGAWLQDA
jgi:carotenoid cleavage dioxygenase-like enzyme